ncbi:MAG: Maf family protein [Bdellovibrionota bacterium]
MTFKQNLILASASPRRKQLLESCGLAVFVIVSNIDETPQENESARDYVLRNAREKGLAVALKVSGNELIVSADTIVVTQDGHILEKPLSAQHAKDMLQTLSNNTHIVYTAYAITQNKMEVVSKIVETKVTFRHLFEEEIDAYIASGEPFDKAGSYGIQGAAMGFVEHIEGSYTNVMGLPLSHVLLEIKKLNTQA